VSYHTDSNQTMPKSLPTACEYTCKYNDSYDVYVRCGCAETSTCLSFVCKPEFERPTDNLYVNVSGSASNDKNTALTLSKTFERGTNQTREMSTTSTSVWTSTSTTLISTTVEETTAFPPSTEKLSSTSEETSTDWIGSGEGPETDSEEISLTLRQWNKKRRHTDGKPSTGRRRTGSEPSYRARFVRDIAEEQSRQVQTGVIRCPCQCTDVVSSSRTTVVCDCIDPADNHRCDLHRWNCRPGTYRQGGVRTAVCDLI